MPRREKTKPFVFVFLVLPYGISSGFFSITLPFVLTRSGFSVAIAASIVAIGVSANLWLSLGAASGSDTHCAPLVSDRAFCSGADAIPAGTVPLNTNTTAMLMAIVFV